MAFATTVLKFRHQGDASAPASTPHPGDATPPAQDEGDDVTGAATAAPAVAGSRMGCEDTATSGEAVLRKDWPDDVPHPFHIKTACSAPPAHSSVCALIEWLSLYSVTLSNFCLILLIHSFQVIVVTIVHFFILKVKRFITSEVGLDDVLPVRWRHCLIPICVNCRKCHPRVEKKNTTGSAHRRRLILGSNSELFWIDWVHWRLGDHAGSAWWVPRQLAGAGYH